MSESGELATGNSNGDTECSSDDPVSPEPETEEWEHSDHRTFTMKIKHATLRDMHDEWFGVGSFLDKHGGVEGRERHFGKHKAKWRRHLDNQHFSRTKRLVQAIVEYATSNDVSKEQACDELETHYQNSKRSLLNTVKTLQGLGLIQKQKDRGRRSKQESSVNVEQV